MPGVSFSAEQRAKAVRLVAEATPLHGSQWAAIESVAAKIGARWRRCVSGCGGLRSTRVRGRRMTSEEHAEIKRLRREVAELRRANEILKAAAAFFGAELDRPQQRW